MRVEVVRHLHHLRWDGDGMGVVVGYHLHHLHKDRGSVGGGVMAFPPFPLGLRDTNHTIKSIYTRVEGHDSHHQIYLYHLHHLH